MPIKTAHMDYNELLPGFVTTNPYKPRLQEHAMKGARPCCAALEKRKRKLGVHVKLYSYMNRFLRVITASGVKVLQ